MKQIIEINQSKTVAHRIFVWRPIDSSICMKLGRLEASEDVKMEIMARKMGSRLTRTLETRKMGVFGQFQMINET
jgi:hypothetical protein